MSPVPPTGTLVADTKFYPHHRQSSQMEIQNFMPSKTSSRMSISNAKGLLNMPGQNNCFLNSAVQVLWHLDIFRRSFRELSGHACMADSCIFCALKELFNQFQYSQESALPPDALRRALAETFSDQRRFQLGFMDDAAECFENILLRIHCHIANQDSEEMCSVTHCMPHCIPHQKFAMNLIEQIICHSCGAKSEAFPFTQMVHYVSTPALVQAKQSTIDSSFGEILKKAGAVGDARDCPRSCGGKIASIKKFLINKPEIVAIGMVWPDIIVAGSHIMDVFCTIGTTLRLTDVFDTVSDCRGVSSTVLQLVGLVTYYGKHYSTFFFHTKLHEWIYFDDATVRVIGPHWEQVVDKCIRGHFQPLLLLYANPNGTPVNTELAPKEVTPLIGHRNGHRTYHQTNKTIVPKSISRIDAQSNYVPSDSESTVSSVTSKDMRNHLKYSGFINKSALFQHKRSNNVLASKEQLFHQISSAKPKMRIASHKTGPSSLPLRPGSADNILNSTYSDVPDSPCNKSSSSYFSDIGEMDSGYISRKTVESILNQQRHSLKRQAGNRNSSSSIESFDIRGVPSIMQNLLSKQINERSLICSLQRRDSGNSSGDRNSASSASVSSVENPYYTFMAGNRRPYSNLPGHRHPPSPQMGLHGSDQGYDSFSLSSTDSYPSVGGPSSPGKLNPRLTQIPEDVQLMELINTSSMLDCDKLCSAADVLLLKSHEKEREGDLRTAAALSDTAAAKARSAMDAPYSNHQTLITAKMKHSMCVMRSASLHKRVKEMESEEKRRIKAEQMAAAAASVSISVHEHHHSRQSSRDSTHSRHSRQGSKDGKDVKTKELSTKHPSLEFNKTRINDNGITPPKTLEIYATLPKKNAKKKIFQHGLSSLASLRIKNDNNNLYKDLITKRNSAPSIDVETLTSTPKIAQQTKEKPFSSLIPIANDKLNSSAASVKLQRELFRQSMRESDFSDYYSEWETTRRSKPSLQRTFSGSASCRENDSEIYGDVGEYANQSTAKKQHRVRRKLMMGGFMKRKNRSLPDLREGNQQEKPLPEIPSEAPIDDSLNGKSIAQISSKGFHQSHRAFITEQGLYQRPSLLKVNPPLIEKPNRSIQVPSYQKLNINSKQHALNEPLLRPPTPPKHRKETTPVTTPTEVKAPPEAPNKFLMELTAKRAEIMKSNANNNSNEHDYQNLPLNLNKINGSQIQNDQIDGSSKQMSIPMSIQTPKHSITIDNKSRQYPQNAPKSEYVQINNSKNSHSLTAPQLKQVHDQEPLNGTKKSVKDLASKFEKIMVSHEEPSKGSNAQNETIDNSAEIPQQSNGHLSGTPQSVNNNQIRMTALMAQNKYEEPNIIKKSQSNPSKSNTLLPQSNIPISTNSLMQMKTGTTSRRPERPPDYQTAIKRLGLMRSDRPSLSLPQTRQFYMNVNGNIVQRQQNIIQMPSPQQEVPIDQKLSIPPLSPNQKCEQPQSPTSNNKKKSFKKTVSFSDQVVLVACAEEDQEEYIPNPILERILGKNTLPNVQSNK